MISNSNSLRHLNNPLNQKVITRNPTYRSTINFGEVSSTNRPFSRKPLNQADHSSSQNIQINDKQLDFSLMQKSVLDTQSVVSGGHSVRQTKFVRTSKLGFLSPKSRNQSRQKSFSPENFLGAQSLIIKSHQKRSKKSVNKSFFKEDEVVSQSSVQQNQIYLQKSISSSSLIKRSNQTRNMILSKFNEHARKPALKENKNRLETSLYTSCMQNQKQEKTKLQKINIQLKQQNQEIKRDSDKYYEQNKNLKQQNKDLKQQIIQLNKQINDNAASKINSSQQEKVFGRTNQPLAKNSSLSNLMTKQKSGFINTNTSSTQMNNNLCLKCEQKQKSNQKQTTYFQNIIKKKQLQISTLKMKQSQLGLQISQLSLFLEQNKMKLSELLEHQKISSQTQQKLQECVNQLKQEIAKLKDELRYLKIQNLVLLKIKNQNLKLKIDITKIQDQKDYFKMKVIEIHKKHGNSQTSYKNTSQKYLVKSKIQKNKKSINTQKPKKFYLDSTQTEEIQTLDLNLQRKKNKSKSTLTLSHNSINSQNKSLKLRQSETEATNYADTLFDLTSEESQNSF